MKLETRVADGQQNMLSVKQHKLSVQKRILNPLKMQPLHSLQTVHVMHREATVQIAALLWLIKCPFQQNSMSTTLLGMTNEDKNIKDQSWEVNSQWRCKWSTDSLLFLDKQHHFKAQIFLLQRLSVIRILPLAAVHVKKATLGGTFALKKLFHGKGSQPTRSFPHPRQAYKDIEEQEKNVVSSSQSWKGLSLYTRRIQEQGKDA